MTLTVSVKIAEAPAASVGTVHDTTFPAPRPQGVTAHETYVVLIGTTSVTMTFVATAGPVFEICNV